ncbi:MAG: transcriptional regulator [Verrucomicrobiales bacterium]|nr:transcriptional regulator [Verrucomicrobiales bacterium]|tara:strand:- start:717 stop:2081 length:1365 start_codon:yes stop_codon:yes gene_type:complete
MDTPQVLIVDDEKPTRDGLRAALEDRYDVYVADNAAAAFDLLDRENFRVLLTDLRMPGDDGMNLIERAKSLPRPPVCILMTAYGSEDIAVEAMKNGADDYIAKGRLQLDELEMRIARALKGQTLEAENKQLKQELSSKFGMDHILGDSPAMKEVLDTIHTVAPTTATVLLLGQTGTGKEVVAKTIHQHSNRANKPMITVHCGALPPQLLESELFGHEKGAFTNAHERRIGRFEEANGGTLFLDEIGEIDASTQIKLLRVLGEGTFERLGSNKTIKTDVRLIAATNKNLPQLVREGTFREDLFYRLQVVEIELPPLSQRDGDVAILAQAFVIEFAQANSKPVRGISPEALELLCEHEWRGNVRELRAAIERAVVFSRTDQITLRDLPKTVTTKPSDSEDGSSLSGRQTVKEAEKELIINALKETGGNRTAAAQKLGMSRRTLHRKLHTYKLEGFE